MNSLKAENSLKKSSKKYSEEPNEKPWTKSEKKILLKKTMGKRKKS